MYLKSISSVRMERPVGSAANLRHRVLDRRNIVCILSLERRGAPAECPRTRCHVHAKNIAGKRIRLHGGHLECAIVRGGKRFESCQAA